MRYCSSPWSCFIQDCFIGGSAFIFIPPPLSRQALHAVGAGVRSCITPLTTNASITWWRHMVTSSRDRSCRRIKCGCLNSLLLPAMMLTMVMFMVGCAWRWTGFTTPSKHAKNHAMTNTSHRHGAGVQQALIGSFYQPVCAWDSLQEQNVPVGAPHTLRMFRR